MGAWNPDMGREISYSIFKCQHLGLLSVSPGPADLTLFLTFCTLEVVIFSHFFWVCGRIKMTLGGVGSCVPPAGQVSGFHQLCEEGGQGCPPCCNAQKDHQALNLSSPVPLNRCMLPSPLWKGRSPPWTYLSFFYNFFIFPLYSKGVRLSLHVYITITFFPHPFFCCNMSI